MTSNIKRLLKEHDREACQWTSDYLLRHLKGNKKREGEDDYDVCERLLNTLQKEEQCNLINRMQTAWRQKKYREKLHKERNIACSFFFDEETLRRLQTLATAGKKSQNQILEQLIQKAYKSKMKQQEKQFGPTAIEPPFPSTAIAPPLSPQYRI